MPLWTKWPIPTAKARAFPSPVFLADQLKHCDWAGFHFEDLIFPLFVFMVGVSLVFSLSKTIRQEGRATAVKRIFRRGILLFVLGLFYSGGFSGNWPDMRLMGVLNRIALCYFFAGLIFCFCNLRATIAVCLGLLIGYWALLTFVPVRDIQLEKPALALLAKERGVPNDAKALFYATTERVPDPLLHGFNLPNHFDFQYLPGRKYDTYFDPEGFLSTFPAIASCLLGVFAGLLLANPSIKDKQKVIALIAAGLVMFNLGWFWNIEFPVIKKIWTSSYVLVAGGCSAFLLGVFFLIIDVWKYQKWCQPFVWMGMNSITIYMTVNLLGRGGFDKLGGRLAGGDIRDFCNNHLAGSGDLAVAVAGIIPGLLAHALSIPQKGFPPLVSSSFLTVHTVTRLILNDLDRNSARHVRPSPYTKPQFPHLSAKPATGFASRSADKWNAPKTRSLSQGEKFRVRASQKTNLPILHCIRVCRPIFCQVVGKLCVGVALAKLSGNLFRF